MEHTTTTDQVWLAGTDKTVLNSANESILGVLQKHGSSRQHSFPVGSPEERKYLQALRDQINTVDIDMVEYVRNGKSWLNNNRDKVASDIQAKNSIYTQQMYMTMLTPLMNGVNLRSVMSVAGMYLGMTLTSAKFAQGNNRLIGDLGRALSGSVSMRQGALANRKMDRVFNNVYKYTESRAKVANYGRTPMSARSAAIMLIGLDRQVHDRRTALLESMRGANVINGDPSHINEQIKGLMTNHRLAKQTLLELADSDGISVEDVMREKGAALAQLSQDPRNHDLMSMYSGFYKDIVNPFVAVKETMPQVDENGNLVEQFEQYTTDMWTDRFGRKFTAAKAQHKFDLMGGLDEKTYAIAQARNMKTTFVDMANAHPDVSIEQAGPGVLMEKSAYSEALAQRATLDGMSSLQISRDNCVAYTMAKQSLGRELLVSKYGETGVYMDIYARKLSSELYRFEVTDHWGEAGNDNEAHTMNHFETSMKSLDPSYTLDDEAKKDLSTIIKQYVTDNRQLILEQGIRQDFVFKVGDAMQNDDLTRMCMSDERVAHNCAEYGRELQKVINKQMQDNSLSGYGHKPVRLPHYSRDAFLSAGLAPDAHLLTKDGYYNPHVFSVEAVKEYTNDLGISVHDFERASGAQITNQASGVYQGQDYVDLVRSRTHAQASTPGQAQTSRHKEPEVTEPVIVDDASVNSVSYGRDEDIIDAEIVDDDMEFC